MASNIHTHIQLYGLIALMVLCWAVHVRMLIKLGRRCCKEWYGPLVISHTTYGLAVLILTYLLGRFI